MFLIQGDRSVIIRCFPLHLFYRVMDRLLVGLVLVLSLAVHSGNALRFGPVSKSTGVCTDGCDKPDR